MRALRTSCICRYFLGILLQGFLLFAGRLSAIMTKFGQFMDEWLQVVPTRKLSIMIDELNLAGKAVVLIPDGRLVLVLWTVSCTQPENARVDDSVLGFRHRRRTRFGKLALAAVHQGVGVERSATPLDWIAVSRLFMVLRSGPVSQGTEGANRDVGTVLEILRFGIQLVFQRFVSGKPTQLLSGYQLLLIAIDRFSICDGSCHWLTLIK